MMLPLPSSVRPARLLSRLVLTSLFFGSLLPVSVCAQQVETPPAPPAPSSSPALIERSVYTPYEQLEKVFEKEDRGVFLPYREFLDLWNKLDLPVDVKKNQPPVDGVLASARYTGRVEGDAAIFDAQLQVEALKDGWSKVPLGGADLNIAEVKSAPASSGQPAPVLHLTDEARYEAILPARGSYPFALTVLGRVTRDAGQSTLALHLPSTAASQFELTIPATGLDFTLWPASAFTTKEENGATRLTAFFGTTQEVYLFWHQRAAETTLPPLVFAESHLETTVGPGALRTVAALDFRLLRAPVGAFEILIPAGQQVLGVEGSDLRDWTLAPDPPAGRQRIVVNLGTPARDSYKLRTTLEASVAALPVVLAVPTVEVVRAEGQSGTITIGADPALAVAVVPREGVTQVGMALRAVPDSSPTTTAAPFLGSYRFLRLPYAVDLTVRAAEPVIEVNAAALFTVDTDTLGLHVQLDYKVTKAGIFAAVVDLPAAFTHVEAHGGPVESFAVVPATPPVAGRQRLEVRFKERHTGDFSVEITADAPRAKPDDPVALDVPRPIGAARVEGRVGVAVHQSLDPNTTAPGGLRQEGVGTLGLPAVDDAQKTPLLLGFRYRGDAPAPAQLAFTQRKPRVSAELASHVALRESLVAYRWTVAYNIEYAGIDDLVLDAPPGVADDLQFTGDDIKEKAREDEKDAAGKPTGRKLWHVRLQQKKLGRYHLGVSVERPLPPPAAGKTATVDWPELKTVGLFHETGTVAVVKDGNLEITHAVPKGLELIDPKELPPSGSDAEDIFLAYRYAAHPASLGLEFSKNEFLPVPTAVVTYAVVNTTLTADRAETTEAIYWVRNNGRQFLSVVLPGRGQMLSDVFVNGQPQQPSRRPDKNALLVRLPARATAAGASGNDAPFSVRLVYSVPGQGSLGTRGQVRVAPPVLEDTRVLQTQWSLYLPAGYRYVNFAGPMREVYDGRGWNWLRAHLDPFVPALGPDAARVTTAEWQDPPTLPAATGGGFDSPVPKEGTPVVLRRLDAPAPLEVSYRSLGYVNTLEAIAFFLALGGGLALLGSSRGPRLAYGFLVGIGALVLAGAVAPRASGLWTAVYLGVFLSALVWLATAPWRWLRRIGHRMREGCQRLRVFLQSRLRHRPPAPPATDPSI